MRFFPFGAVTPTLAFPPVIIKSRTFGTLQLSLPPQRSLRVDTALNCGSDFFSFYTIFLLTNVHISDCQRMVAQFIANCPRRREYNGKGGFRRCIRCFLPFALCSASAFLQAVTPQVMQNRTFVLLLSLCYIKNRRNHVGMVMQQKSFRAVTEALPVAASENSSTSPSIPLEI